MGFDRRHGSRSTSTPGHAPIAQPRLGPGKQTLVSALPAPAASMPTVAQRRGDAAASGVEGPVAHPAAAATPAPSGGGRPLPDAVRAKMERSFGADFSAVRIHESPEAAARGALAYTEGTEIHLLPDNTSRRPRPGRTSSGTSSRTWCSSPKGECDRPRKPRARRSTAMPIWNARQTSTGREPRGESRRVTARPPWRARPDCNRSGR